MIRLVLTTATCIAFVAPAYAGSQKIPGSIEVAQVATGATGGTPGGLHTTQAVVPSGATGGKPGGLHTTQGVVPSGTTGGKPGGLHTTSAKKKKKLKTKH